MPHIEFVVESANVRPDRVILSGRAGASALAVGDRFTAVEYRYHSFDEKTGREQLGEVDGVRAVSLEVEEILSGSSMVERLPERTAGVIRCAGVGMECFEAGMPMFVRVLVGETGEA